MTGIIFLSSKELLSLKKFMEGTVAIDPREQSFKVPALKTIYYVNVNPIGLYNLQIVMKKDKLPSKYVFRLISKQIVASRDKL